MLELSREILERAARGERFALATVTEVHGSAPRPAGTSMLVDGDGRLVGNVSGGCVDGAVARLATEVLEGAPARRAEFGIDDETAFAAGLSCGGELEVFVQAVDGRMPRAALERAATGGSAGLATVVAGPETLIGRVLVPGEASLGDAELAAAGIRGLEAARLDAELAAVVAAGRTATLAFECEGETVVVFVESRLAPPLLFIAGAITFAAALADAARLLGYRIVVCDPRPAFATAGRFPSAHEVVAGWPASELAARLHSGEADARTAVCVLTHDADVELPLLALALESPLAYVGAMGSRRSCAERARRLAGFGVAEADLARLRSPIGLDLGAATPAETAVSILAEIVAVRTGRDARALRDTALPIHIRV